MVLASLFSLSFACVSHIPQLLGACWALLPSDPLMILCFLTISRTPTSIFISFPTGWKDFWTIHKPVLQQVDVKCCLFFDCSEEVMEERFRNSVERKELLWGSIFLGWPIAVSMLNHSKMVEWKRRFWVKMVDGSAGSEDCGWLASSSFVPTQTWTVLCLVSQSHLSHQNVR